MNALPADELPHWLPQSGLPEHAWQKLQQVFHDHPQVERVVLFGSRAKVNHQPGSDIDLCAMAPTLAPHALWALDERIDDLLLPWKVDLVLHHTIDTPALLDHIQRVGQLMYMRTTATNASSTTARVNRL